MSMLGNYLTMAAQFGLQLISIRPARGITEITTDTGDSLSDIIAHAVIEESHTDTVEVTDHPVEYGAMISDHAYKKPSEVALYLGWSDSFQDTFGLSGSNFLAVNQVLALAGNSIPMVGNKVAAYQTLQAGRGIIDLFQLANTSKMRSIYSSLLKLQELRSVFNLTTGKKFYQNMVCTSLTTETTEKTENILLVRMICREVIRVNTRTVTFPTGTQSIPQKTASEVQVGTSQMKDVPSEVSKEIHKVYSGVYDP